MADQKISQFDPAGSLDGTEVLPLVKNGQNVKTTVQDFINLHDRGEWDATGNLFPSGGGSGSGGVVKKGDEWLIVGEGTLGESPVSEVLKLNLKALYDNPLQDESKWKIY